MLRHSARLNELSSTLIDRLSDGDNAVVDQLAKAERELAEIGRARLLRLAVEIRVGAADEAQAEVRAGAGRGERQREVGAPVAGENAPPPPRGGAPSME